MKTLLNVAVAAAVLVSAAAASAHDTGKPHRHHHAKKYGANETVYTTDARYTNPHATNKTWFDRNTAARDTYFGYKVQATGNPGDNYQMGRTVKQH